MMQLQAPSGRQSLGFAVSHWQALQTIVYFAGLPRLFVDGPVESIFVPQVIPHPKLPWRTL